MERVKIKLPANFTFSTIVRIRITDLNLGGHVGNDTFLSLLHEARHEFLKQHGYGETSFENAGLIMADAAIEYKKELVQGDEVKISVAADGFDKFGFDLFYKMEVVTATENILAGKAKTGMLCFDYTIKKIAPLPEKARLKLQGT
ncbi:thioesterase [Panacibacter ginsenosidivorans]|uniref:Thioesterase n=1 Tax=Panacibacter ginsenosidivorans TaxID=1813871 RepID=A0A5B8VAP5_9BACT|nr:thioesterase family protein [Panacibacter ginsenosidivorans]QEC67368.1 thioesterase [Panacibacter ginsenosidivorans]